MGIAGPGIFDDDVACDVRYVWREALMDGLDSEAATAQVFEQLGDVFEDDEEGVVAWLALAAAQSQTGRLLPRIRDRALELIDDGGDIEVWREEPTFAKQREKVLAKLAEKLRGPQPPPRTLRRPKFRSSPLDVGDVVHVRNEEGQGLFVVVALARSWSPPGEEPILAQLFWDGTEIPDDATLATLPLVHEEPEPFVLELHSAQYDGPVQVFCQVDSPTRGKNAFAHYGTLVARGVTRPDAADPMRDQSRGFGDGPVVYGTSWGGLLVGEEWYARRVEATRRVYGL